MCVRVSRLRLVVALVCVWLRVRGRQGGGGGGGGTEYRGRVPRNTPTLLWLSCSTGTQPLSLHNMSGDGG